MQKKKDVSLGMLRQDELKNIPDQIDLQGGYRKNIGNYTDRAESLSDVIKKIKDKGGSAAKMISDSSKYKKLMGAVPLLGAGMAALSGDPAMAAEEVAMDVAGPAGEALRSESAGMSPEDEAMMLAEIDAQKAYQGSPARLSKLQSLMGKR